MKTLKDPLEFATWRTMVLNMHENGEVLRQTLAAANCRISNWANEVLRRLPTRVQPLQMDVAAVIVSVGELGFPGGALQEEVYSRAMALGLELCPPEMGPLLRIQYLDQPPAEWLLIGMRPVTDRSERSSIFVVEHVYSALWIDAIYGSDMLRCSPGYRFVFCKH